MTATEMAEAPAQPQTGGKVVWALCGMNPDRLANPGEEPPDA